MFRRRFPTCLRNPSNTAVLGVLAVFLLTAGHSIANAQLPGPDGYYSPLDQNLPPGIAGQWAARAQRSQHPYFQPMKIVLPTTGSVAVYSRAEVEPVSMPASEGVGLAVGFTYRLRLSDMPEFPGIEMYPTIEILDRLHPPSGKAKEFPVPVEFTEEEIQLALSGGLVTKVIYLEQPQRVLPDALKVPGGIRDLPPSRNLLTEADRDGRPMVLVRLGSRTPDANGNDRGFFGYGSPIRRLAHLGGPGTPGEMGR